MVSKAATVDDYLSELSEERRVEVKAVRSVVNGAVPEGIVEGMQYGMIGWFVPHSIYPAGYHCDKKQPLPFVHLAAQKNNLSLYLFCSYGRDADRECLAAAAAAQGKKLDAGKACLRFKRAADLPLEAIAQVIGLRTVAQFIEDYEANIKPPKR